MPRQSRTAVVACRLSGGSLLESAVFYICSSQKLLGKWTYQRTNSRPA